MVLSDFELMVLFKYVLQHGFDTSSTDSEYWEEFTSLYDVMTNEFKILMQKDKPITVSCS